MEIDQPAADDCGNRCALHFASVKRRVTTLRLRTIHIKHPIKLRIENRNVRMRTLFQRTAIAETKNACGICRAHFHNAFEIDQSLVHEIERESDRCFKTGYAKRRLIELQSFFVEMMWRVIGGD